MTRAFTDYSAIAQPLHIAGGIDASEPVEGFYRMKLRSGGVLVGIRLWFGPPHDPITGEEMDRSWRWQAEANGEEIDFLRVWPVCADDPITEAEYQDYTKRQKWAQQNAPETAFADPRRPHDPLTALLSF